LFLNISCGIKLLLNKFKDNNNKKKRIIKDGEQDDNEIAQTAASSLLALVNELDESNKFDQLDEMPNHMSKIITEQQSDLQEAGKEKTVKINRDEKQSSASTNNSIAFSSSSEDKTMTPPRGLRKEKKYNESSSNSEDDKICHLRKKTAEPLHIDGNWQNED
jgi:hypothetical protein